MNDIPNTPPGVYDQPEPSSGIHTAGAIRLDENQFIRFIRLDERGNPLGSERGVLYAARAGSDFNPTWAENVNPPVSEGSVRLTDDAQGVTPYGQEPRPEETMDSRPEWPTGLPQNFAVTDFLRSLANLLDNATPHD